MKQIISTTKAPAAIGPYSQAVRFGNTVFFSGQIAIHPDSGELILDSIQSETRQVMENIGALLKELGCDYSHIIKSSIFLSSMGDFAEVNNVYASYFNQDFPARETVEVSCLPKNVNVEISVIVGIE